MHAVDPLRVREHAEKLTELEIAGRLLERRPARGSLVVLSGGNPLVHNLTGLVRVLHEQHLRVSVETQGSHFRPWIREVDRLVVSPKPPSSEMATADRVARVHEFLDRVTRFRAQVGGVMKIVCFDEGDLAWAIDL